MARRANKSAAKRNYKNYALNVFLNCPFDDQYEPLRQAIVFTVVRCGFIVRCADEVNEEKTRFSRILNMIDECKYGIHDLSRIEPDKMPRNNMPLELGIFIGSKEYQDPSKDYLVLDSKPHRYKEHITDLGGQDPSIHHNDVKEIIKCIRNWLAPKSTERGIVPSHSLIHVDFENFLRDAPQFCLERNLVFRDLTFSEYYQTVVDWLQHRQEELAKITNIPMKFIDSFWR